SLHDALPIWVAEDLGVTVLEPQHGKGIDARVPAGHQRHTGVGLAIETTEVEVLGEGAVRCQKVVEVSHDSNPRPAEVFVRSGVAVRNITIASTAARTERKAAPANTVVS